MGHLSPAIFRRPNEPGFWPRKTLQNNPKHASSHWTSDTALSSWASPEPLLGANFSSKHRIIRWWGRMVEHPILVPKEVTSRVARQEKWCHQVIFFAAIVLAITDQLTNSYAALNPRNGENTGEHDKTFKGSLHRWNIKTPIFLEIV